MNVLYRTRPYESVPGSANELAAKMENKCADFFKENVFHWVNSIKL